MKKSVLFVLMWGMLAFTPKLKAVSDIFSVNFYGYGKSGVDLWDQTDWRETVTMEAGQYAGVGAWNTSGWANYNGTSSMGITSTLGSTATIKVDNVRNYSPYYWTAKRTALLGNGDADMMDGQGRGTEDPYDGSMIFDSTVSNITFDLYDVVIYVGSDSGNSGNDEATIVFNSVQQNFKINDQIFDGTYTEYVDDSTPCNYLIFRGLTASSFSFQIWGAGFNHIGPRGLQIMEVQPSPPDQAVNPTPADSATKVWCGTKLSWTLGYDADSSDVYFGTNPTPGPGEFQSNQTTTTFDPGTLTANTTYYWRIDQINDIGTTTGQVWSFTTNDELASLGRNTFLVPMTYTGAGWEELAFLAAVPASTAVNDGEPSVIALDDLGTIPEKVYEYLTLYNPANAYVVDTTGTLDDVACYLAQTFWTSSISVVLCDESDYAGSLAASALAGRMEIPLMFFDSSTGLSTAALSVIVSDLQCTSALTVNGNSTVTGQLSGIAVSETALADDKAIITWMENNGLPVEYLAVCNTYDRGLSDYAPKGSLASALLAAGRNGAVAALNYETGFNIPFFRSSTTTVKPTGLPYNAEPPRFYHDPEDLDYDLGSFTLNGVTHDFVVVRIDDTDKLDAAYIDFNNDGDFGDAGEYCPRASEVTVNGRRYTFGVNSTLPHPYANGEIRFSYPSDDEFKEKLQEYHNQIGHYPKFMAIVGIPEVLPCAHALSYDRGWCDYVMNDNYYADVDADPMYDIALGRIVGENVTYVTLNATRALTYDDLQTLPSSERVFHQCTEEFANRLYYLPRQLENYGFTVDEWLFLPDNQYSSYGVFIQDEHGWPYGIARDEFLNNAVWTTCLIEGGGCNMGSMDMYWPPYTWDDTNAVALAREGYVCFNAWVRGTGSNKTVCRDAFYKAILNDGATMGEAHQHALNIYVAKNADALKSYELNANMLYGDPAVRLYKPTGPTYQPANVTANGNTLTVNSPATYTVDYVDAKSIYVYSAPGIIGCTSEAIDGTVFATYTTGLQISGMTQESGVPSPLGWQTLRDGQNYVIDEHWDNTRTIYWRVRLEEFDENTGQFSQAVNDIDYTINTYDNLAPLPNPGAFASAPAAASHSSIMMTAATGIDASGPVEYYFDETSGNPGGTDSGWQTSPTYTDTDLTPLTQYTYTVKMRDALGNTTAVSVAANATTMELVTDLFSVNLWNIGKPSASVWDDPATHDTLKLAAGQSAGASPWNTTGWENVQFASPFDTTLGPVTINSSNGSTAALEVTDRRNGSPYNWNAVRDDSDAVDVGNATLLDAHSCGTEDPYDGTMKFDMTVSGITLDTYDVIIYLGINSGQKYQGKGQIVFNGFQQAFTMITSEPDGNLVEIVDSVTPGNYIVFEGITGSSFTVQVWGDAFTHLGPSGFQIYAESSGGEDTTPPTPNPATFASVPVAVSDSAVSMSATTGSDPSGPVEYYFDETSGNPGGTDSGWQTSSSYTDTGLNPNTQYTYTVTMRDILGNTGTASGGTSSTTDKSIYEMEDGVLNGPQIASNNAGYTGTGFADYLHSTGDYVELTVNSPNGGSFNLSFRYALAAGDRPLEIKVNGQVVNASLSFPATGNWTTWGYTATLPVTLNAGNNTVRATAIGYSGANVDHLLVE